VVISKLDDLIFGVSPKPIECGTGLKIGTGRVVPEINFTLPTIEITGSNMPEIRRLYEEMIDGVLQRSVELGNQDLLVEFETLPEMTKHPAWGLEITGLLATKLRSCSEKYGTKTALRLTPNDTREFRRPPFMRQGSYLDGMVELFTRAGSAGADLVAIESTGGKEVCDQALVEADLWKVVFALGVLGARDMRFLWQSIVDCCSDSDVIPSGDTACGFANTAMVLADRKMIPKVFAAVVRVASVPRSLVAYEVGAVGPSKDCAYEGPYLKAIAGIPISMEGKSAACAHLSPVGNISMAVCDCWSNESVQNVQLLSDRAPVVSLEQLVYDCRLMNCASDSGRADALRLRDWLVQSDASLDPQAWVLRPDVVLKLSAEIMKEPDPYSRTRTAVLVTIAELREAHESGELQIPKREISWLDRLDGQAAKLPSTEEELLEWVLGGDARESFLPSEYGF